MLKFLKMLVLAFKPISDAEAMAMNLNGPQVPKQHQKRGVWRQVDDWWKSVQINQQHMW